MAIKNETSLVITRICDGCIEDPGCRALFEDSAQSSMEIKLMFLLHVIKSNCCGYELTIKQGAKIQSYHNIKWNPQEGP